MAGLSAATIKNVNQKTNLTRTNTQSLKRFETMNKTGVYLPSTSKKL
jgi:hypothetical protein